MLFGPGEPSGARAPRLNLTGGAHAPVREEGEGEERLTGEARLSSLTL